MTKDRVTYFSDHDGSIWMYRPRFVEVMDAPELMCGSLVDALELYHIKLFVEKGLLKSSFDADVWQGYQKKARIIPEIIARFINEASGGDLVKGYEELDFSHHQSFWDVLEGYGQAAKLTDEEIATILERYKHSLSLLLRCKKIVRAKNEFLRGYMMAKPESAVYLLSQTVEKHIREFRPYHFPVGLDYNTLLASYIELPDPNANYLRMILNARDDELRVLPELKIRAKEKIQELFEKNKSNLLGFSGECGLEFSEHFADIKALVVGKDGTHVLRYNSSFFLEKDDTELVNYLGLVFEYLDSDKRITLVNKDVEATVFERVLLKAKSEYAPNAVFSCKNSVAVAKLAGLDSLIRSKGRNIETAIEVYFNQNIKNKYGLPFKEIRLLKEGDYGDRAKVLLPFFDTIVKQYNLFVSHGKVSPDLMKYYPAIPVTDAKSLVGQKYCQEAKEVEELNTINYLLFSDQSLLGYVDPFKENHYETLYAILSQEEVRYEAYEDYQRKGIDLLVNEGYIKVDDDGVLRFFDVDRIDVLHTLYHNRVCSFWRRSPKQRLYMLELIEKGWAVADNHLLSEPERDYFSYCLNDRQYSDAESLRNNILHGVSKDVSANEYYRLLLLFILLLLKVDDDIEQYSVITMIRRGVSERKGPNSM